MSDNAFLVTFLSVVFGFSLILIGFGFYSEVKEKEIQLEHQRMLIECGHGKRKSKNIRL